MQNPKMQQNFAKTNIVQVIKTDNCLIQFKKSAIKTNKLLKSISNAIEAKSRNRSQDATRGKNSPLNRKFVQIQFSYSIFEAIILNF